MFYLFYETGMLRRELPQLCAYSFFGSNFLGEELRILRGDGRFHPHSGSFNARAIFLCAYQGQVSS
ncbi:hypothetical protein AX777_10750 [Sphingobium yanoikuyae]|uniref:Uncharacterized protein n=1 Tax=Sphingobium yanoikuyae TaxID=13690 RepID=A0A177JPK3_SPHYA|nr:hypothetical protein AX777_10750 [Sphingobium yanoikuyae]